MSKGRILIVDNRPDHIPFRRQALEREGYEVREAYTPEDASEKFETGLIHLAIVDIRLKDENDEKDWSGLEWVESVHQQYPEFPCIILTGFPSYEPVQRARKPDEKGLPPAEDFISKGEGLELLVKAVNNVFLNKVKINYNLKFYFEWPLSFFAIADALEAGTEVETRRQRALEVEDLFRKLLSDSIQAVVRSAPQGRGGATSLQVRLVFTGGSGEPMIVKCGPRRRIAAENSNYTRYVAGRVEPYYAQKLPFAQTLHYSAITYYMIGEKLEDTQQFSSYYRTHTSEDIQRTLDYLFFDTLKFWYRAQCQQSEESLNSFYRRQLGLTEEHHGEDALIREIQRLSQNAEYLGLLRIEFKRDGPDLTFQFLDGRTVSYPNPIPYVYHDRRKLGPPVLTLVTHGDLNEDNILADRDGRAWPVDFERTGYGPVLRDFVELEAAIRFDLVETTDLQQLYTFEECLLAFGDFTESIQPQGFESADLQKAFAVINHLRWLASQVPGASLEEYYMGLLFDAAWVVVSRPPREQIGREDIRKAHALLSATMICRRLEDWAGTR